jgi:hypothetical protein
MTLTLQVEGAARVVVKPGKRVVGEAWEVTEVTAPATMSLAGNSERWEQVLRIEPKQPGEHKLLVAAIEFQIRGSAWQKSAEQELVVVVTTTAAVDGKPIGLPPPIEELPAPESINWPIIVAIGLSLLLLAGLVCWLLRRRRKLVLPAVPAEEIALRELDELGGESPSSPEEINRFHTRLANIVRKYLEARFQVPAMRQTSAEYYQALVGSARLNDQQSQRLHDFLSRCDQSRYAAVVPSPDERLQTVALARHFVQDGAGNTDHET